MSTEVAVYAGEELGRYAFPGGHPFGPYRLQAFLAEFGRRGFARRAELCAPVRSDRSDIELFHAREYVDWVRERSAAGHGYFDWGDTPVFPGAYEAAATVAGTTLAAVGHILSGRCRRARSPAHPA